jgi:hypothetical protein
VAVVHAVRRPASVIKTVVRAIQLRADNDEDWSSIRILLIKRNGLVD